MTALATASNSRTSKRVAIAAIALTFMLVIAGIPLSGLNHQAFNAGNLLMLPFALVGGGVALRQPRNPIGWIMLALAASFALSNDSGTYAAFAFRFHHPGLPLARLAVASTQSWVGLIVLLPLPILLFPDGRLPSPRWRWPFRVYLVACAMLVIGTAVKTFGAFTDRHVVVDSSGELASLNNAQKGLAAATGAIIFILYAVLALSFVVGQLWGYRRATGDHRQQLKWLIGGSTVGIVGLTTALVLSSQHSHLVNAIATVVSFGVIAVPLGIGVGILKYRLYDIDRLISRTLSYAIVTGLLIAVYFGMVTLATRALPLSSPIGVAASTLTVAALFAPLRRRAQHIVDRRFNRARYDAEATVAAFAAGLRDEVDLNHVQRDLLDVVQRCVEPSQCFVWVRQ